MSELYNSLNELQRGRDSLRALRVFLSPRPEEGISDVELVRFAKIHFYLPSFLVASATSSFWVPDSGDMLNLIESNRGLLKAVGALQPIAEQVLLSELGGVAFHKMVAGLNTSGVAI